MNSVDALVRNLDETVMRGSSNERARIVSMVTDLLVSTAERLDDDQIGVFDVVIGRLIRAIETHARAELAERLSTVSHAPAGVVRQLAHDEIGVARPILVHSQVLTDQDLIAVSAAKGRDHMLAITQRADLAEPVTDFLILRGGRAVTHAVAANRTARFSRHGIGVLVMRAVGDDGLHERLGARSDVPSELVEQLTLMARNSARQRLAASVEPALAPAVDKAVERGLETISAGEKVENELGKFHIALAAIREMQSEGRLDEARLAEFATAGALEHAVCALAALADLSLSAAEQVILGRDRDAVLVVVRALGWSWPTAAALIGLRGGINRSPAAVGHAQQKFETLMPATAQRVLGFLRARGARSDN